MDDNNSKFDTSLINYIRNNINNHNNMIIILKISIIYKIVS